ncbi:MAG: C69 family dipeptidase [Prevotella sp.]|jgi:dipeptidase|uniref:dipeptidase n=1 Tax=Prevotella sp. Rep29 TaxID=2691580 RepID=UPI001C6EFCEB|nr:C69 family dipeptidase [Prevotella sp. Rep29]MBR7093450.1 C69 family dipeptidase [Prevotella sp.]QYR10813.1 peptidase [Prevotella sp. Rep29]
MKKTLSIAVTALLLALPTTGNAQNEEFDSDGKTPLSCTSIMVGKKASTDGSVITSHTCDSWYRTWMKMVPAKDHKAGTKTAIYEGRMHTQSAEDSTKMYKKGEIPQVSHTFRFLDTAYPCLNEKQLGIGETTITGRKELRNKQGMFMIEELERIALERCSTARDAIRLMGELIKQYGYGDSGECLTIADKNEVWIFEVFGEGPKKIGGVWAAVRIPDDHIAVSANICRINKIDTNDKENYMYSDNLFDVAKRMKLWDGKEEFSFWRVFSGGNYFNEKKNYSVREHFIMNALAPSQQFSDQVEDLPLSVKPDEKVSVERVMQLLGSYYEGTAKNLSGRHMIPNPKRKDKDGKIVESEPDSIVSPFSNPWMRPDEINMYYAMGDSTMKNIRTVSVPWCAYSTVIQLRSWLPDEVGGVAWVALDNPGQSPRFPIFCGTTKLPKMLEICGQHTDRDDAALWRYRKANRLATVRWGTYRKTMEPARDYFIDKGMRELPFVEKAWQELHATDTKKAQQMLNGYTADFFGATIIRWDEMARHFWRQTWGGF